MLNRSIPNRYRPAIDRSKRLFQNAINRSTSPLEEEIIEDELKNVGIESIEQYLKIMESEGPVEPWLDLVTEKYLSENSDSSDCLKFFCLGRFHEIAMSLKDEIRGRKLKRDPPVTSGSSLVLERERKRARSCDKGSSASSFVDPRDLSRFIERSEPYDRNATPEIYPKPAEAPPEDLIKKSNLSGKALNCLSARIRLFNIAFHFRRHSSFMEAARRARLKEDEVRKHLWSASSATVRSEKTIHTYCARLEDFIEFLHRREIDPRLWSGEESTFP